MGTSENICEVCQGLGHVCRLVECDIFDRKHQPVKVTRKIWERCVCANELVKKQRLGLFYDVPRANAPVRELVFKQKAKQLILIGSLPMAKSIISAKLREDTQRYKLIDSASELVDDRIQKKEQVYSEYPLLFLCFGFSESPSSFSPALLAEVVNRRHTRDLHCWVFAPQTLAQYVSTFPGGDALRNLDYIPVVTLPETPGQTGPVTRLGFSSRKS